MLRLSTALFLVLGLACGGRVAPGARGDAGTPGDAGAPLTGTAGTWTWIDVPGTSCDDGSTTGVAINPAPGGGGGDLVIYFMGGGACWDAGTCFVLNTAVHGPFRQAQWESSVTMVAHALDRARATHPFR